MMDSPILLRDIGNGRKHRLFLSSDELRQIKRECGRGFYTLYRNFQSDAEPWEVETVIRLALIGGGMDPTNALELVEYYCRPPRPLKGAYLIAYEVLDAAWAGIQPETSAGGDIPDSEVDKFFDTMEAALAAGGNDTSPIQGKSIAEVQQFARMFKAAREGKETPAEPPSVEIFNAIKRAGEGMK